MRHQADIQVRASRQDAAGEPVNTWDLFATRRVALERETGGEVFASAQREGRVPITFRLRWLEGVTSAMRVVLRCGCCSGRGINYVRSVVDPTGLKEELVVAAEEHPEERP